MIGGGAVVGEILADGGHVIANLTVEVAMGNLRYQCRISLACTRRTEKKPQNRGMNFN
jgi:hypothetical protein